MFYWLEASHIPIQTQGEGIVYKCEYSGCGDDEASVKSTH